jgi:hypothetical protein
MPCPPYSLWLNLPNDIWGLWSSSLCNFLYSPVTSSLLDPNILLITLFSNTLILCSFLNVRDQVSHPYKTTGRIMVFIFKHLHSWTEGGKTKHSESNGSKHSQNLVCSWSLHEYNFELLVLFPNVWTLPLLQRTYSFSFSVTAMGK